MLVRLLTDNKSLRKKFESSTKAVYKKVWLKIVIPIMSTLKRTSKASINMYADMGSPWCEPFSKLKYGIVNPPFI